LFGESGFKFPVFSAPTNNVFGSSLFGNASSTATAGGSLFGSTKSLFNTSAPLFAKPAEPKEDEEEDDGDDNVGKGDGSPPAYAGEASFNP